MSFGFYSDNLKVKKSVLSKLAFALSIAFCVAQNPLYAYLSPEEARALVPEGAEVSEIVRVIENEPEKVPELILGAWERSDRIIFFDEISTITDVPVATETAAADASTADSAPIADVSATTNASAAANASARALFSAILKTYYGWFYDRAAEPVSYSENTKRFRCVPTPPIAENLSITFEPLLSWMLEEHYTPEGEFIPPPKSGAWEMVARYSNREITRIPLAVIDGKLYLDFILKGEEDTPGEDIQTVHGAETAVRQVGNTRFYNAAEDDTLADAELVADKISGYWRGISQKRAVLITPLEISENLYSYYFVDGAVYTIRYWRTDMDLVDSKAYFTDGDHEFHVNKHLVSCGEVFTCATGRRSVIRNISKSAGIHKNMTFDSTRTICAFDEPYLTKTENINSEEKLMEIVASANSRRKPDLPPIFPPSNANWHWDDIYRLEAGNEIIEKVRQRQREFAAGKISE